MIRWSEYQQADIWSWDIPNLVARLICLQKQVKTCYHHDRFMRDRLVTAVNIPSIQVALWDQIPRTAQQLIKQAGNRLPVLLWTAGSSLVHYYSSQEVLISTQMIYMIRKIFGRSAHRPVNPYGKGPTNARKNVRRPPFAEAPSKSDQREDYAPSGSEE